MGSNAGRAHGAPGIRPSSNSTTSWPDPGQGRRLAAHPLLGLLELLGRAAEAGPGQQGILQALVVRRYLVAALVIDPGVVEIPGRLVEHAGEIERCRRSGNRFHLAYQAIELGAPRDISWRISPASSSCSPPARPCTSSARRLRACSCTWLARRTSTRAPSASPAASS